MHPKKYGIQLHKKHSTFAKNDIAFTDPTGVDHESFHPGLKKAVYNYMLGMGLFEDVRSWFDFKVPKAKVKPTLIQSSFPQKVPSHFSPVIHNVNSSSFSAEK